MLHFEYVNSSKNFDMGDSLEKIKLIQDEDYAVNELIDIQNE